MYFILLVLVKKNGYVKDLGPNDLDKIDKMLLGIMKKRGYTECIDIALNDAYMFRRLMTVNGPAPTPEMVAAYAAGSLCGTPMES